MPLDPGDENFGTILRAKGQASTTLINAQLRVDENRLRRRTLDKLPELLAIILEEEKKLPPRVIEHA